MCTRHCQGVMYILEVIARQMQKVLDCNMIVTPDIWIYFNFVR